MSTMLATPDFAAIKERQQATWASGDYAVVGTTLQIVGERLCDAIDICAGERILDVAAGNGNATLAAARQFGQVTSTDYVNTLLDRGRERAAAERLPVTFGLASWTPDGFIGQLFKIMSRHVPPPAGIKSPALWGTVARLEEMFAGHQVKASKQIFNFRYKSPSHWLGIFKTYYGPTHRAFAALDATKQAALEADLFALLTEMNRGGKDTLIVPSEYLEAVITRA